MTLCVSFCSYAVSGFRFCCGCVGRCRCRCPVTARTPPSWVTRAAASDPRTRASSGSTPRPGCEIWTPCGVAYWELTCRSMLLSSSVAGNVLSCGISETHCETVFFNGKRNFYLLTQMMRKTTMITMTAIKIQPTMIPTGNKNVISCFAYISLSFTEAKFGVSIFVSPRKRISLVFLLIEEEPEIMWNSCNLLCIFRISKTNWAYRSHFFCSWCFRWSHQICRICWRTAHWVDHCLWVCACKGRCSMRTTAAWRRAVSWLKEQEWSWCWYWWKWLWWWSALDRTPCRGFPALKLKPRNKAPWKANSGKSVWTACVMLVYESDFQLGFLSLDVTVPLLGSLCSSNFVKNQSDLQLATRSPFAAASRLSWT